MEAKKMLNADILDILFENRNKKYGAYMLRKEYDSRLARSIFIVFTSIAFVLFLVSAKGNAEDMSVFEFRDTEIASITKQKNVKKETPKGQKKQSNPSQRKPIKAAGIILVVADSNVAIKDSSTQFLSTGTFSQFGGQPFTGLLSGGGGDDSTLVNQNGSDSSETHLVLDESDIKPTFPGGMKGLNQFLRENLEYPEDNASDEMTTVSVRFVVGYDGKLQDIKIVKDGGKSFNVEVLRVINKMPDWIPGKSDGKNVSVYYQLPVHFLKEP